MLVGVTYDGGTTYQPGARFAPYHVRRVSALVQSYHPALGVDVFETLRAVDGGNVAVPPFSPEAVRDLVQGELAAIAAAGAAPFVVGGDHSITLPALRALAAQHGPLAVVHVDAHLDTSGPEVWGEAFHHGTPIRHALTENLIQRGQLFQIGIRGAWRGPEDDQLSKSHGASVYMMPALFERGVAAVMAEVRQRIGDRPVYLSFDVDAIDPSFAPGTGTPVPGGLTSREALALVRALAGTNLIGMDVVEVSPPLDVGDATSNLAAYLLFEGMAALALSRK